MIFALVTPAPARISGRGREKRDEEEQEEEEEMERAETKYLAALARGAHARNGGRDPSRRRENLNRSVIGIPLLRLLPPSMQMEAGDIDRLPFSPATAAAAAASSSSLVSLVLP